MERSEIFMDLKRFYSEDIDFARRVARLSGEEFYHAARVTRHKVGYKLIVFGDGEYDYYCTVEEIGKEDMTLHIDGREINNAESGRPVTLYIGANKDLDTVVQKAVEMGASKIVPFTSAHGNVTEINLDRLKKIVLESSKQCGRARLAEVCDIMPLKSALNVAKDTNIYFFYEFERDRKTSEIELKDGEVSVFIGCEGGFSTEERDMFLSIGAYPFTLGRRILRVGTAVVAALTTVNVALGEL